MDFWMCIFWYLIGICNAAFAAEHFRKQHDFRFGFGVMGVFVSVVNVFLKSGLLQYISA